MHARPAALWCMAAASGVARRSAIAARASGDSSCTRSEEGRTTRELRVGDGGDVERLGVALEPGAAG